MAEVTATAATDAIYCEVCVTRTVLPTVADHFGMHETRPPTAIHELCTTAALQAQNAHGCPRRELFLLRARLRAWLFAFACAARSVVRYTYEFRGEFHTAFWSLRPMRCRCCYKHFNLMCKKYKAIERFRINAQETRLQHYQ